MNKPTITIIMSTYNTPRTFLTQSITSIQSQTYSDWELIICDDGSTDNTYEMLEEITAGGERIKLIHNKENRRGEFFIETIGDDGETYWYKQDPESKEIRYMIQPLIVRQI